MQVHVIVRIDGAPLKLDKPATLLVEAMDVSLVDAPSVTLSRSKIFVTSVQGEEIAAITLPLPDDVDSSADVNIWCHLSLSGQDRIQQGDYLSMEAYPVPMTDATVSITVTLRRVGD
ncbi:MAG: hypothetical protein OEV92_06010 [Nitrospinota bacterium]|nr:hypothetical protein [Nitrospinota bacterium]